AHQSPHIGEGVLLPARKQDCPRQGVPEKEVTRWLLQDAGEPCAAKSCGGSKGTAAKKRRKFVVSIASVEGGGKFEIQAESSDEAARKAYDRKFPGRRPPRGLSVIVTDVKARTQKIY